MNKLLIMTFVLFSAIANASDENKNIDQMINALKLEKRQAETMIEMLNKRGRMTKVEAARAKRDIASVKEEDVQVIKAKAFENIDSKNSFATK